MIRVALYGAGQLAHGLASRLADREDVEVIGPEAHNAALLTSAADVVIIATTTLLADVIDDVEAAVRAGSNVMVSSEEAAFPWNVDETAARRLHAAAVENGVTILGAGLNPGLLFDAFVLTLLGAHALPTRVHITRVVNVSRFGPVVRGRLGLGYTEAEFEAGRVNGQILGHAGFAQSMRIVGDAIGLPIDHIDGSFVPLWDADRRTVGFHQTYTGSTAGRDWFVAEFIGHVDPEGNGLTPRDTVLIDDGTSARTVTIDPGVPSQEGSVSVIANSIDRVIAAPPGWLTVADLPPAYPRAPRKVIP
jgi:hypothetical protein